MTAGNAAVQPGVPLVARVATDVLFRDAAGDRTTAHFLHDVARVAAALPAASHVFNLCADRYWFTVAFAAALLRGQVSLLTSDRSPERLAELAREFEVPASVGDGAAQPSPLRHLAIGPAPIAADAVPAIPSIPSDRLAAIVFTSGSTGRPVGTRKHWGALAARSVAIGARFGLLSHQPPTLIGMVPGWHMYGFETTILLPLHAACASWSAPVFYPSDLHAALAAAPAPRLLVTTPLQLRAVLQAALPMAAIAGIISATAPLDPALAAEAEQRWGTPVREIFGATEIGSIASRRTVEGPDWTMLPGIRLAPGASSVHVTATDAPAGVLTDVVELDGPERFRLLGRASDMVKLGGRRASLAGLNRALTDIPGVTDGVFLAPDDLDSRPTARLQAFVIAPDRSPEDILAALRARIDPVFLPRRIVRVESLPRNELGKLPRDALRVLEQAREDQ